MKFLLSLFLLSLFFEFSYADTLYLKNGHSIDGIIKSDDGKILELEVGLASSVSFLKSEIESIKKDSQKDSQSLRQKWQERKLEVDNKIAKQELEEENKPKSAGFSHNLSGMVVNVILNNKVEAKMVLDTGASVMIITKNIADKLKLDMRKTEPDTKMQVADGRKVNVKRIIIDRVAVEGVEARNVEAAVLMDDTGNLSFSDGLLGMSFLKRFNFKVDQKEKKLILEKLYGQE